ncbi:hypothetical protein IWX90DRAFT_245513 [Phyllosticta citrichinensis]|uniref:Uncharacterized protein n=1 Tax=Phyllosticta citrichinensis TaxID=1130410 RepID=A0ABR1XQJ1_9PEZI
MRPAPPVLKNPAATLISSSPCPHPRVHCVADLDDCADDCFFIRHVCRLLSRRLLPGRRFASHGSSHSTNLPGLLGKVHHPTPECVCIPTFFDASSKVFGRTAFVSRMSCQSPWRTRCTVQCGCCRRVSEEVNQVSFRCLGTFVSHNQSRFHWESLLTVFTCERPNASFLGEGPPSIPFHSPVQVYRLPWSSVSSLSPCATTYGQNLAMF